MKMRDIKTYFNDFLSLIFPSVCASCGRSLLSTEDCICTFCHYQLPKTDFHLNESGRGYNPIAKLFWGRVDLQNASAYYIFTKGGNVQRLIHKLKYRGRKDIGVTIGKFYGAELKQCKSLSLINNVLPVPLHPHKLKKRTFNQSEHFANGLSLSMNIPTLVNVLIRTKDLDTQTKRNRYARWENIKESFKVVSPDKIQDKHILLVDDVITTGATIEACANELLKVPGVKVSVAAIAYAQI